MKPKISIITLAVADLERALVFYRDGLGLPTYDHKEGEVMVFFELQGTWLGLYPREKFDEETDIPLSQPNTASISLAHNVQSKKEVDEVVKQAVAAGARLVTQPKEVFWGGYSGHFTDPDGHLWEVAYNPFVDLSGVDAHEEAEKKES